MTEKRGLQRTGSKETCQTEHVREEEKEDKIEEEVKLLIENDEREINRKQERRKTAGSAEDGRSTKEESTDGVMKKRTR